MYLVRAYPAVPSSSSSATDAVAPSDATVRAKNGPATGSSELPALWVKHTLPG